MRQKVFPVAGFTSQDPEPEFQWCEWTDRPGKLDEETKKKLDAWWKEKGGVIFRAGVEQFRKEMKNGQVVELKGATHYVFVGQFKDQVIKLMRDFLLTK